MPDILGSDQAAVGQACNTSTYPDAFQAKTSLHSGVVKLALQVLRDAAQDTGSVKELSTQLEDRTGDKVSFAGTSGTDENGPHRTLVGSFWVGFGN